MDEALLPTSETPAAYKVSLLTVCKRFLSLGFIAFGGPPAHVALMLAQPWRPEMLDDKTFASLFALTQFLPGPSSTQLATALGVLMGGPLGGIVAFLSFSVFATTSMTVLGTILGGHFDLNPALGTALSNLQAGLTAAAIALVAKAALTLATKLATDSTTQAVCTFAAAMSLFVPNTAWLIPLLLAVGGVATVSESAISGYAPPVASKINRLHVPIGRLYSTVCLVIWLALLIALILATHTSHSAAPWWVELMEPFYRIGSMIWGGGPVVLPMLLPEVVPKFVSQAQFLQGFAYVQAMPGPMFNFSAFLGGLVGGPAGAIAAWGGLFLPGILFIHAALPYWGELQASARAQSLLRGVNAACAGLVIAAVFQLFDHITDSLIQQGIALVAFAVHHLFGQRLFGASLNPPATVAIGAVMGFGLCYVGTCYAAGK